MEMSTEAWAVVGVVITGVLTYLGVRRTARASERAGQATASIDASATALGGFKELTDSLHAELRRRDEAIKRVEDRQNDQDDDLEALRQENREQGRRIDDLQRRYKAAIRYILTLRQHAIQHAQGEPLPQAPPELQLILDMED